MVRSIFIRLRCLWEPQKTCYSHTNRWQPELWHVQQHLNGSTHRTAVKQTACMVGVSFGQKLYFVCWKPDEELIKKDLQIGITSSISAFVYLIPTLFRLSSLFFYCLFFVSVMWWEEAGRKKKVWEDLFRWMALLTSLAPPSFRAAQLSAISARRVCLSPIITHRHANLVMQ